MSLGSRLWVLVSGSAPAASSLVITTRVKLVDFDHIYSLFSLSYNRVNHKNGKGEGEIEVLEVDTRKASDTYQGGRPISAIGQVIPGFGYHANPVLIRENGF